jgi:hypothetical protein
MKRHPIDITSLIAGLMFATFGVLFTLDRLDEVDLDVRWVPAVALIGLGLANLLGSIVRRDADRDRTDLS